MMPSVTCVPHIGRRTLPACLAAALLTILPQVIEAQEVPEEEAPPAPVPAAGDELERGLTPWSATFGVGFTADPDTFLLGFSARYELLDDIRLGPILQLGLEDDRTIVAPALNLLYAFRLDAVSDNIEPFIQGGVGFAYIDKDHRRGDDDDIGFLIDFGFGLNFYLTDQMSLGSSLLFNVLPDEVVDENFFFSWQVLTASFHF